jgi:hypothetical protein
VLSFDSLGAQSTNDGVSQLASDVSDLRTSLARQVEDHAEESTSNVLLAEERLIAEMNSNKNVLLAQLLSSQDALCSRISDLDSHLRLRDTEQTSVREHIANVTHVAHATTPFPITTKKQKDARFLKQFLALAQIGFQKLFCYTPRDIYAPQDLSSCQARKSMATEMTQPHSSTEVGNSAFEDLVNNISVALVSVSCCILYRNPSAKKAFQKWIANASSDPVFAALLVMTAIWVLRCLTQLPRQLSLLGGNFVLFEDALGVPLRVPFSTCEHFKIFSAFVEVHFEGKPGFRQVVRRNYHLTIGDSRGVVIEHSNWKDLVKPRSRISMAMLMMTYTTMCAKCGLLLDPQVNGELYWQVNLKVGLLAKRLMIYSESCDQLYTLSYKEIAASEHEIFAPARTGQEIHGGNEGDAAFKLEPKAMGPSRAKPVKSELSTPQSESHGGLHLSDITCFKNVHLVLEAGHVGQGGSLDTETNTKGINLQSRHPSRAPTVSSHPSFKSLIQDVAPILKPTETPTRTDVTRSGENAPAENQRDASFEEDTNSFADTTASNLVPPMSSGETNPSSAGSADTGLASALDGMDVLESLDGILEVPDRYLPQADLICPFQILDCEESFSDIRLFKIHVFSHFRGQPCPTSATCFLCEAKFVQTEEDDAARAWNEMLSHLAYDHFRRGQRIATVRTNFGLMRWMYARRIITDAQFERLGCREVMLNLSKEIVLKYIPQLSNENLQNKEEDVNNYTLAQAILATLRLVQPQGSLNKT